MDIATIGVIVAAAIGVITGAAWVGSRIWGARGMQDSLAKSVETLGLMLTAKIDASSAAQSKATDAVMTETRLQTQTINNIAANLARVETNQRAHELADETRFKEVISDQQRVRYEAQTISANLRLVEQEVDQLQEVSKARHQAEITAFEEAKRRRQMSPLPFPSVRDPRKDPSDR